MRSGSWSVSFRRSWLSLHNVQEMHRAALEERCRVLAQKPRIHAALEDNALDLLYPNAKDELRDLMEWKDEAAGEPGAPTLHATFYRFLDGRGAVITPPSARDVGELRPEEEAQLSLGTAPGDQQIGYLWRKGDNGAETVDEVIAMPDHLQRDRSTDCGHRRRSQAGRARPPSPRGEHQEWHLVERPAALACPGGSRAGDVAGPRAGADDNAAGSGGEECPRRDEWRSASSLLQMAQSEFALPARLRNLRLSAE